MTHPKKLKPIFPSLIESVWWIGFTDREGPTKWWNMFTKKGFRHVYAYAGMGERVLVMQMTKGGLVISSLNIRDLPPTTTVHAYLKELYGGRMVIPALGQISESILIPRRAPFTCVELVRSLLGIDKMLYTPFQLYKYIMKHRLAGQPL